MSANSPHRPKRRKQRVDAACDFCRRRKLGCDNAKPKCTSCALHKRECSYTVRERKERPSNYRIQQLQEDNSRLRRELDLLRDSGPSAPRRTQPSPVNTLESLPVEVETVPDAVDANFHGPTSAIFDGKFVRDGRAASLRPEASTSDSVQLLGETAKQRQLELIHLRQETLDFDGIDPTLAECLLHIFWNRQHAIGSIVYRPSFMRDMACNGPYFSRLLLNAIYFVSSEYAPSTPGLEKIVDCSQTGLYFRRKAEAILYDPASLAICRSSITAIQALLLISDGLFSWCDERSLSWQYLGIATNMIIDLGLHSENASVLSSQNISPEELEIRRRLFWAAFVLDKVQSIYQGRPARLRDMDCNVPMVFMDNYEELEPFDSYGYVPLAIPSKPQNVSNLPIHSVSTFQHMCKLSTITDRILCNLYTEKSATECHDSLCRLTQSLHLELEHWRESLPPHLNVDTTVVDQNTSKACVALPHTLALLLMYHSMVILLHRPFVSGGHLTSNTRDRAKSINAFSICESAALEINALLCVYKNQWCIQSPPYFVSYATYVSATIHVRLASQKSPGSQSHVCLQNCFDILGEHKLVSRNPMQSIRILTELSRRLNVQVNVTSDTNAMPVPCDLLTPDTSVEPSRAAAQQIGRSPAGPPLDIPMPSVGTHTPNGSSHHSAIIEGPVVGDEASLDLFALDSMTDELPFDFNFDFDPLFGFVTY